MQIIKSISISYFRSIHRLRIETDGDLVVLSGANDVGKSNVLKALNLFFNGQTDWLHSLEFYKDFSLRRLDEVRRETVKGKQFIRIEVEFYRPENYKNSLPPIFKVTKKWFRDGSMQEDNNLKRSKLPKGLGTARRMLSQFLGRVRFEYVPAIRSKDYFEYVLRNLQETLLAKQIQSNNSIIETILNLNESLGTRTRSLSQDFVSATGIQASISLPKKPQDLFRALSVSTKWRDLSEQQKDPEAEMPISLSLRGDGIQARFISSLLWYIANSSGLFYIWGFEEPENSLEYNMAIDLAKKFVGTYSRKVHIFVTSHSPAFLSLKESNVLSYRVYKDGNTTEVLQIHSAEKGGVDNLKDLSEELGLLRLQSEFFQQYLDKREDLLSAYSRLKKDLEQYTSPVVYVEGKTDARIIETAWLKLYPEREMPFVIKPCDPLAGVSGGTGGAETLAKLLSVVPGDNPQVVIGIFDGDKEGKHRYDKLPRYFEEDESLRVKISSNRRAAAFILPVPPGRENHEKYLTLTIEFYFKDEVLSRKTADGEGLVLEPLKIKEQLSNGVILEEKESSLPATQMVKDGKMVFANKIVPHLDAKEFEPFHIVFDKIEAILKELENPNPTVG